MISVSATIDPVWFQITSPRPLPPEVGHALKAELRYHPDGYERDFRYRSGQWDGYATLWDGYHQRCRRGLAKRALRCLLQAGVQVELTDLVPRSGKTIHLTLNYDGKEPREFQERCRDVVRANDMGIISSPTGTGKTFMTAMIIQELGMPALVILNDLVLMDQTQYELEMMLGTEVGLIGASEFDPKDITVATVQSLVSILRSDRPRKKPQSKAQKEAGEKAEYHVRLSPKYHMLREYLRTVRLVIHDEVHLGDSAGVAELYPNFVSAERVYGLSATPYEWADQEPKDVNLEQEQHFGRVIYDTVHEGYDFIGLRVKVPVAVEVVRAPVVQATATRITKKEFFRGRMVEKTDTSAMYKDIFTNQVLKNSEFHKCVAEKVAEYVSAGMSNFVFVPHSIEYLDAIHALIPGAVKVTGKTNRMERRRVFQALHRKEILCVVSDVGGTGLNVQSLDVLHNCSDYVDVRQLEGRVARAFPGKEGGILVDYFHDADFLRDHYRRRRAQYKMLGNLVINDPLNGDTKKRKARVAMFGIEDEE